MGTVYAELGTKVSVVELTDGLLPGADRDLVKPLHKRLERLFAGIYLNTKVAALGGQEGRGRSEVPERRRRRRAHRAVQPRAGLRRPPAEQPRLRPGEHEGQDRRARASSQIDEQLRTADPHILAIGDVAGEPMLAHKASHEGRRRRRSAARRAGGVRPAGDSGGRLHRSGDRLGRPDRRAGQSGSRGSRDRAVSLGGQRAGACRSAGPRG